MLSAQNLADRYGVTKAAILAFVKSNIDVINKDGQNAFQTGPKKSWEFTDEAVKIIDKLRDVSSYIAERPADAERVQELLVENSNLKTALLLARNEVDQQKNKVISLLESAPVKELVAAQSDLAVKIKENEDLQKTINDLKIRLAARELQLKERQKPWWKFWD